MQALGGARRDGWEASPVASTRMLPCHGLPHVRRILITVAPALNIAGKAWPRDEPARVRLPLAGRTIATLGFPDITLGRASDTKFQPRAAIHLGSGKIVHAEGLAADAFAPIDIRTKCGAVAHMETGLHSDARVLTPDGNPCAPTRIATSVRSRGGGTDVDVTPPPTRKSTTVGAARHGPALRLVRD